MSIAPPGTEAPIQSEDRLPAAPEAPTPTPRGSLSSALKSRRLQVLLGILLLVGVWSTGMFDKPLSNVGLNRNPCLRTTVGGTLCGGDAERACKTLGGPVCAEAGFDTAGSLTDTLTKAQGGTSSGAAPDDPGVAAALAGQQVKAQDASAKSDARNAVSQIESCYTDTNTYATCDDATENPDLPAGVVVDSATATTYEVVARSASGHEFNIAHTASGTYDRTCTGEQPGGCTGGVW